MTQISREDALAHFGVPGMKWGVRNSRPSGVSSKTNREAKKDAAEAARAKMFYGEGAGTRRKLINNSVAAKSKRDPAYKKAFDEHYSKQDLSTHASKARSERKRKDVKKSAGKGIRGTRHILNGNSQYASAATALIVGGALYAYKSGIAKKVFESGKATLSAASKSGKMSGGEAYLRSLGIK